MQKDNLLPMRALPIDDHQESEDSEYCMPDEYGEALAYLRGVRDESQQTPSLFKSKVLSVKEVKIQENKVYQDSDICMSISQEKVTEQHKWWKKEWIDQVLMERIANRGRLLQVKTQKFRDADQYFDKIQALIKDKGAIQDCEIAQASELVLQEIFGILACEKETSDFTTLELEWLFGLLCLLEKPLLADQAGDLNQLLQVLQGYRSKVPHDHSALAQVDLNMCLITEYFGQRFK